MIGPMPSFWILPLSLLLVGPGTEASTGLLQYAIRLGGSKIGSATQEDRARADGGITRRESAVMSFTREGEPIQIEEHAQSVEDASGNLVGLRIERIGMGPDLWIDSLERIESGWRRTRTRGARTEVDTLPPSDLPGPAAIDRAFAGGTDTLTFWEVDPIAIRPLRVTAVRSGIDSLSSERLLIPCSVYHLSDALGQSDLLQWRDKDGGIWKQEDRMLGWIMERETRPVPEPIVPFETMDLGNLSFEGEVPSHGPCTLFAIPTDPSSSADLPFPFPDGESQRITRDRAVGGWRIDLVHRDPPLTSEADRSHWNNDPDLSGALQSDLIIDSDHRSIVLFATEQVRGSANPTEEALALERAVHRTIEVVDLETVFATASQTLAHREGDCTEHAILLAACCRARSIPARVVAGLVPYGPRLGFHLWTEVYLGSWTGLDAVIGQGHAHPCALAIARWERPEEGIADFNRVLRDILGKFTFRSVDGPFRESSRERR